jgi:hypothetical protein
MRRTLLLRIFQLVFFAAVGFANWYKAGDTDDKFYQIVQVVCGLGFIAVLFSLYFSWRKGKG